MSKQVKYPVDFDARDVDLLPQELYGVITDRNEDDDSGYLATFNDKSEAADGGTAEEPIYVATYRLVKIESVYLKRTTEVVVEK